MLMGDRNDIVPGNRSSQLNRRKLRIPPRKGTNLFASDFLEQPGARKVPVIIDGGQRNPQNLRCLLVVHPSEIPQFDIVLLYFDSIVFLSARYRVCVRTCGTEQIVIAAVDCARLLECPE